MSTPSKRLSALAGQAVEINILEGETLDQAEDRVMKKHPDVFVFGKTETPADSFDETLAKTTPQPTNDSGGDLNVLQGVSSQLLEDIINEKTNPGIRGGQVLNQLGGKLAKVNSAINLLTPKEKESKSRLFTAGELENVNALKRIIANTSNLLNKKNSGFSGRGINTGPIIGGQLGDLIPILDVKGPSILPDFISEAFNKETAQTNEQFEDASARSELKQLEKLLFNPIKKDISGTAVSDAERFVDLEPLIPTIKTDDQAFFNKGFQTIGGATEKLKTILETASKSGIDISEFSNELSTDPALVVEELQKQLSQFPEGSFAEEFPSTFKKFSSQGVDEPLQETTPLATPTVPPPSQGLTEEEIEKQRRLKVLGL